MTILRGPKTWRRDCPANPTPRPSELTLEEQGHVKAALRVLMTRLGGQRQLAAALRVTFHALQWTMQRRGKPGAGMALRAARLAGVHVEDILAGKWPVEGGCPHCGRV